ncbi:MAG: protein-ADP-ribose hydrolase [Lactimicrobium sp.]|jgi:O-acetyl-ADP-ribose deacetylase (regulator of RNase III)|uniref:protein-ADP-ribose hydrolase n=1 Tax=Lactimicrobium sp. TaxID=2563780 RepID=UPI002F356BB3
MNDTMAQTERLDYLLDFLIKDEDLQGQVSMPEDVEDKRKLLRALMNVRMPKIVPANVLAVQDAYLQERNKERGIVKWQDLPDVQSSGSHLPMADHISLWQGDITTLSVDAIVNAANSKMLGCFVPLHNCIDNCIHTYAGIELRLACARGMLQKQREYGSSYEQPTSVPMLTSGYNLPASHVIHVVGPIISGALTEQKEEELAACYTNVLYLCVENHLRSVAFCCISTGVFHFPPEKASAIAVNTVTAWLQKHPGVMDRVIFNVFTDQDRRYYEQQIFG